MHSAHESLFIAVRKSTHLHILLFHFSISALKMLLKWIIAFKQEPADAIRPAVNIDRPYLSSYKPDTLWSKTTSTFTISDFHYKTTWPPPSCCVKLTLNLLTFYDNLLTRTFYSIVFYHSPFCDTECIDYTAKQVLSKNDWRMFYNTVISLLLLLKCSSKLFTSKLFDWA